MTKKYGNYSLFVKKENSDVAVFLEVSQKWAEELKVLRQSYPYIFHSQDNRRFGKSIYLIIPLENRDLKITAKYQNDKRCIKILVC